MSRWHSMLRTVYFSFERKGPMRKPMLEALAACLALAAVSGLACAAIQTDVKSASAEASRSRSNGVSNTADNTGVALSLFPSTEVTMPHSDEKVPATSSIRANADVALLTSVPTDRSGTRSGTRTRLTTGVHAPASNFRVVDPLQSNTFGFSLAGTDDFTLGRRYGTELKRRAIFNQHDVGVSRGEVVTAGSSQIKVIQTVQNKDSE